MSKSYDATKLAVDAALKDKMQRVQAHAIRQVSILWENRYKELEQQLAAAEAHEKLAVAEARLHEHVAICTAGNPCCRKVELQAAVDAARDGS
jgi:hypothetical protein